MSNVLCGCETFMKVTKNGVTVEELDGNREPYKLWRADLYTCPDCQAQVITGFGSNPIAEHFQPSYKKLKDRAYADGSMYQGS